ncbi:hypothetical protein [Brevibacillus sedimenti]|uniref:hypothetical protein n=1 Tax=Brevibacillus sedimenti TaxID=2613334 RepID=UPI001E4172FD|nr:hypothetical protein [Anoxybacillus sediminis]
MAKIEDVPFGAEADYGEGFLENGFSPNYYGYDLRQIAIMAWTLSEVALNRKLRVWWEQHDYWTRLAVNSRRPA